MIGRRFPLMRCIDRGQRQVAIGIEHRRNVQRKEDDRGTGQYAREQEPNGKTADAVDPEEIDKRPGAIRAADAKSDRGRFQKRIEPRFLRIVVGDFQGASPQNL